MILRSIRIEGWRCFIEPLVVGRFGDGLNVVHGPNGVGKTSLFMALGRGLFDDHGSAADGIKQLRPWGRELAPRVTIEFEHTGVAYKLHKQFLDSRRAELSTLENGRYLPKSEGRAADQLARDLLRADHFSKRKGLEPQAWGLAQVLWAPQGELAVGELSGPARQSLQQALGAQVTGGRAHAVEERAAVLYGAFFTPGGKFKSGAQEPRLAGLERELAAARQLAQQQRDKLAAFDDASRRLEDFQGESQQANAALQALEAEVTKARQRADEYQQQLNARELQQQTANAAKAQFEQWKTRVDAVQAAAKSLLDSQESVARLEADSPSVAKSVELHKAAADEASEEVEATRRLRADVDAARTSAELARTLAETLDRVATLDATIARIEAARGELDNWQAERRAIIAPDGKQLLAIQKHARQRDDARLQLDASLIMLHITVEQSLEFEVQSGESTGLMSLAAGEATVVKGSPDVHIRLPGVGTIRATGPTGSADELRRQWEGACEQLIRLTRGYGTQDLEELQRRATDAQQLEQQITSARATVETLLSGRDLESPRQQRDHAARQSAEVLAIRPEWEQAAPSAAKLAATAHQVEQEFRARIDAAENHSQASRDALSSATLNLVRHEKDLENCRKQLTVARQALEQAQADGQKDEQRRERMSEAALQWHAAQAQLIAAEQRIAGWQGDPRNDAAVLERQVQGLRDQVNLTAQKLHTERERLRIIIDAAPYSALAAAEETIARLEDDFNREKLRLDAIRFLYETLTRRKREIVESLVGPVCQRAQQTLTRIAGSRFERLAMNENFDLEWIVPRNSTAEVSLDQLSGGEREQILFAVRLALADVAFAGTRQLVVLDDVFTYTDSARLARIVSILQEAAERFQIILLTCHPERYHGLPSANFFDLEEIVSQSRAGS